MPIVIRPSMTPNRDLDLTKALTAAVAHELWRHAGGNEVVNWLEAERVVASLSIRRVRREGAGGRHAGERSSRRRVPDPEVHTGPIPHLG